MESAQRIVADTKEKQATKKTYKNMENGRNMPRTLD